MAASHLIMVRPAAFCTNKETSADNIFQHSEEFCDESLQEKAVQEFDTMVSLLQANNVEVTVFNDHPENKTPDSIFPNNWFSTHASGEVVLYPLMTENRRAERRTDLVEYLMRDFEVTSLVDFRPLEDDGEFLEGTGSLVLDHENKVAYMCQSERSDERAFSKFCESLDFSPCSFEGTYLGKSIYHTNVMMSVGEKWVIAWLSSIDDNEERTNFVKQIHKSGKELIPIDSNQLVSFLGNCIEIKNSKEEHFLLLSETANRSLRDDQKKTLQKHMRLLPIPIPTIETYGGGSVRCMVTENYLTKK